jgi:8-oxo-dGTP diphosphatase
VRHIVNALLIRDGNVLLARRSPHRAAYAGLWSFPGGHQEPNETLTEALVREVQEEMGVTPTDFAFLRLINDPNTAEDDAATYHMYAVTAWEGGEPALVSDEHTELRWLSAEQVSALTDFAIPEYRPLLVDALRGEMTGSASLRRGR